MTPREALTKLINILENSSAYVNEDGFPIGTLRKTYDTDEAEKVLEALVLASEQAPTLKKLGYERKYKIKSSYPESIKRLYVKDDWQIWFEEYPIGKKHVGLYDKHWESYQMSYLECLACAEIIKEMEETK